MHHSLDFAENEMTQGYLDGLDADSPEPSANRTRSYCHGFQSGRDDLRKQPSDTAARRRIMAEAALAYDRAMLN